MIDPTTTIAAGKLGLDLLRYFRERNKGDPEALQKLVELHDTLFQLREALFELQEENRRLKEEAGNREKFDNNYELVTGNDGL